MSAPPWMVEGGPAWYWYGCSSPFSIAREKGTEGESGSPFGGCTGLLNRTRDGFLSDRSLTGRRDVKGDADRDGDDAAAEE